MNDADNDPVPPDVWSTSSTSPQPLSAPVIIMNDTLGKMPSIPKGNQIFSQAFPADMEMVTQFATSKDMHGVHLKQLALSLGLVIVAGKRSRTGSGRIVFGIKAAAMRVLRTQKFVVDVDIKKSLFKFGSRKPLGLFTSSE